MRSDVIMGFMMTFACVMYLGLVYAPAACLSTPADAPALLNYIPFCGLVAPLVKCLLCEREDLSPDSQHLNAAMGTAAGTRDPRALEERQENFWSDCQSASIIRERQDQGTPCWLAFCQLDMS